ncbi:MAG TPA: hypothetical protein VF556_02025 [Pyrinomonadaceae bacterium]
MRVKTGGEFYFEIAAENNTIEMFKRSLLHGLKLIEAAGVK